MNDKKLVELEKIGLDSMNSGQFSKAVEAFSELIRIAPDFEHGSIYYDLAYSLEELGQFDSARKNYVKALSYDPCDTRRLGGYASFLYLHGEPQKALEAYFELITQYRKENNLEEIESCRPAVIELAKRINSDESKVLARFEMVLR